MRRLRRQFRLLQLHAAVTTTLLIVVGLSAFRQVPQRGKFDELDVGRLNIREPDGKLRMVISNRSQSPGPIAYGKPFGYAGGSRPGIIFFNDEETENGGLTFSGKTENGKFSSTGHLSFDQYNQDQVVYLQYIDENGRRRMGLTVADRTDEPIMSLVAMRDSLNKLPDGPAKTDGMKRFMEPRPGEPIFAQRLYVGRDVSKNAVVNLSDKFGKVRMRLLVDSLGKSSIDFMDDSGRIVFALPDSVTRRTR